jgi:hypothetical protein
MYDKEHNDIRLPRYGCKYVKCKECTDNCDIPKFVKLGKNRRVSGKP